MPYIAGVLPGKTGQRTGNSGQLGQQGNLFPRDKTKYHISCHLTGQFI
jgi:hypothetical protein